MTQVVAIVGPTCSGKTDLALGLAQRFGGEIVCADSRTLYREMDIGTAKPSAEQRRLVPHHLLDVAQPDQPVSAAEYKRLATAAIGDIAGRDKLPIMVGGSGLYMYSVAYDFQFPAGPRSQQREKLELEPLPVLVARLRRLDPERAGEIDLKNKRRVVRALETVGQPRLRQPILSKDWLLLGLRPTDDDLQSRIARRTQAMLSQGLVREVDSLTARYGVELEVLKSPGYAEISRYLNGQLTLAEAEELINLHTRQLARRQITWFKRNPDIQWLEGPEAAAPLVRQFLSAQAL